MDKTTELKIEKNVPMPERRGRPGIYTPTLRKMDVGDSVVLPLNYNGARLLAQYVFGRGNYRGTKLDANNTRIWRTA